MIGNLTFGKYIFKNSLIHKFDPRVKLLVFILLISLIFVDIGMTGYLILGVLAIMGIILSKLPLIVFWRSTFPILIMTFFIAILNMFLSREGSILFHIGSYAIYQISFERTLQMFLRILLMVQFTVLLTSSTRPIDISTATSALLRPFKLIKLPVNEIGIMVSITLRFIPTLLDEASIIISAQSARGVDFKKGELIEKGKAIVSLVVPLFVSALGKAEDLSNAMEARGYNPKIKRSKYRKLCIKYYDVFLFFLILSILVFFILLSLLPEIQFIRYLDRFFELW